VGNAGGAPGGHKGASTMVKNRKRGVALIEVQREVVNFFLRGRKGERTVGENDDAIVVIRRPYPMKNRGGVKRKEGMERI